MTKKGSNARSKSGKNGKVIMRKAPQAPKRFRSSYILFYAHVRDEIKTALGGKASGPVITRKASEQWKGLSVEDRKRWELKATNEKMRYEIEKAAYTGPWKLPYKSIKKDPTAPKRNASAFLLFTQGKRQELRKLNPETKNTEISRMLGRLWRDAPMTEKRPYIERELDEREAYKCAMTEWKKEKEDQAAEENVSICAGPSNTVEGIASREGPLMSLKYGTSAYLSAEDDKAYNLYRHPTQFSNTAQDNYGAASYPPDTVWYDPNHQHTHEYFHSPQDHHRYEYAQDVNIHEPIHYPYHYYMHSSTHQLPQELPQQFGSNYVNERHPNFMSSPNSERRRIELEAYQQHAREMTRFPSYLRSEDTTISHQNHPQNDGHQYMS